MPICGGARTAAESRTTSPPGRTRPPPPRLGEGWRARSLTTSAAPRRVSLRRLTGTKVCECPPRPGHLSLARSLARPFLRPPFRGESLRATENHHRRAGTDRPTERGSEGATDRVRWHVVQRQLLQRASQGRERGASYRCGYVSWPTTPRRPLPRSAPLRFRPSVRPFDGPSDVRPLRSQCPFARSFVRRAQVRSPLLRTAVRAVTGRSENREEERASRSLLEQKQLIPSPPPRIPRTLHCF